MDEFIYAGCPWPAPFGPVFACSNPLPADLVFCTDKRLKTKDQNLGSGVIDVFHLLLYCLSLPFFAARARLPQKSVSKECIGLLWEARPRGESLFLNTEHFSSLGKQSKSNSPIKGEKQGLNSEIK